jgi:hypothetical protein
MIRRFTGMPGASGGERRNPGSYAGRPRRRHAGGGKSRFFRRFVYFQGFAGRKISASLGRGVEAQLQVFEGMSRA